MKAIILFSMFSSVIACGGKNSSKTLADDVDRPTLYVFKCQEKSRTQLTDILVAREFVSVKTTAADGSAAMSLFKQEGQVEFAPLDPKASNPTLLATCTQTKSFTDQTYVLQLKVYSDRVHVFQKSHGQFLKPVQFNLKSY